MTTPVPQPLEPHHALWLEGFLGWPELAPSDPRMQRVRTLQAAGLISAMPVDTEHGTRVVIRVTDLGYERLGRTPKRGRSDHV